MEITANALQTVNENQNVYFTDTLTSGNCGILHRDNSGLITLKGVTNQCRARFKVSFNGNISIPTGGTVEEISLAIGIDGEPVGPATMIVTPTAAETFWNVSSSLFIDVARNCCVSISVINTSTQAINVQNANLIAERVA